MHAQRGSQSVQMFWNHSIPEAPKGFPNTFTYFVIYPCGQVASQQYNVAVEAMQQAAAKYSIVRYHGKIGLQPVLVPAGIPAASHRISFFHHCQ